jgi:hypothetical protein
MRAGAIQSKSRATAATETRWTALADYAEAYGDQTERDHRELVKAIKSGRVKAAVVEEGA